MHSTHPAKGTACTTHVHKCDAKYRKMSNLTPHQRSILRKRKCSLKRLKYEYKTNVLPYVYACQLWALKNYTALVRGLFVCIVFLFVLMSTLARPNITLSDNPTLEDLHMTGSVVVFEGNDLNGEQRVLEPGIYCMYYLPEKIFTFYCPELTFYLCDSRDWIVLLSQL